MICLTVEDVKRIERAMAKFNTCEYAGSTLIIEVKRKENKKSFLGHCDYKGMRVDVEPVCRKCLRYEEKKRNKPSKKTAATRARIKKGRLRQRERKNQREDPKIRRKTLEGFH